MKVTIKLNQKGKDVKGFKIPYNVTLKDEEKQVQGVYNMSSGLFKFAEAVAVNYIGEVEDIFKKHHDCLVIDIYTDLVDISLDERLFAHELYKLSKHHKLLRPVAHVINDEVKSSSVGPNWGDYSSAWEFIEDNIFTSFLCIHGIFKLSSVNWPSLVRLNRCIEQDIESDDWVLEEVENLIIGWWK